jgi:hypothetical protein
MIRPESYRKKPVEIEAMRLTADNAKDVCDWISRHTVGVVDPADFRFNYDHTGAILIETLEGTMRADVGDWVIRGVKGEFYPCKPDIFDATYERVEDDE